MTWERKNTGGREKEVRGRGGRAKALKQRQQNIYRNSQHRKAKHVTEKRKYCRWRSEFPCIPLIWMDLFSRTKACCWPLHVRSFKAKWNRILVCFLGDTVKKKKGLWRRCCWVYCAERKPFITLTKKEKKNLKKGSQPQCQSPLMCLYKWSRACQQRSHGLRGLLFTGQSCSSISSPEVTHSAGCRRRESTA